MAFSGFATASCGIENVRPHLLHRPYLGMPRIYVTSLSVLSAIPSVYPPPHRTLSSLEFVGPYAISQEDLRAESMAYQECSEIDSHFSGYDHAQPFRDAFGWLVDFSLFRNGGSFGFDGF